MQVVQRNFYEKNNRTKALKSASYCFLKIIMCTHIDLIANAKQSTTTSTNVLYWRSGRDYQLLRVQCNGTTE